jgi:hypothetical protein
VGAAGVEGSAAPGHFAAPGNSAEVASWAAHKQAADRYSLLDRMTAAFAVTRVGRTGWLEGIVAPRKESPGYWAGLKWGQKQSGPGHKQTAPGSAGGHKPAVSGDKRAALGPAPAPAVGTAEQMTWQAEGTAAVMTQQAESAAALVPWQAAVWWRAPGEVPAVKQKVRLKYRFCTNC